MRAAHNAAWPYLASFACWSALLLLGAGAFARIFASEPSGVETRVLGDGESLGDMISGTYGRSSGVDLKVRKKQPAPQSVTAKINSVARSGLTKAAPAQSQIPAFALFGEPVPTTAVPPPLTRSVQPAAVPPQAPTYYRTVCVRLCDGAFFPINYSTTSDRFGHDEEVCRRSCSSPAKLYVYETHSGSPATMADRDGRPYTMLQTAFAPPTIPPACADLSLGRRRRAGSTSATRSRKRAERATGGPRRTSSC